MIYQLNRQRLIPGKMAEYSDIFSKEWVPFYPKIGMKMAGSFHAYTGNMNETYTLYAFDDLAAHQKVRALAPKDKDWQKIQAKLVALQTSQTTILLEPNPWSPMK